MKTKLFTFLGLVVAGIGVLSIAQSSPVYAAGETYRWANSTTIEASGGLYPQLHNTNTAPGKPLVFTRQSDGIYTNRGGEGGEDDSSKCSISFRLVVGSDNVTGTLTVNDPSGDCDAKSGFDTRVKVENPNGGPPMNGQEVDYRTVDCAVVYAGDDNFDRCVAVKACVVNKNLAVLDCLRSWYTCLISRTTNGNLPLDKRAECAKLVTDGNLAEAGKGVPVGGGSVNDKTTCSIPGLGWLICPAIYFLASLTDGTYYVIEALLRVQPILATPGSDTEGLYNAWQVMRNFANIAFVIAFLVIIFSQITSAGVSNYGLKKLLPRLIIAAILVNISYWLCAIAVDISNIAGGSLKSLFDAIAASVDLKPVGGPGSTTGLTGIAEFALGGVIVGAGMYIMLSALLPVLVGCLITVIIVFVVLVMRQALIVLLIAISPLAFVAYLLPNTEKLFNQWRDLFWTLLLMYPAIALIFGASAFASKIVTGGT